MYRKSRYIPTRAEWTLFYSFFFLGSNIQVISSVFKMTEKYNVMQCASCRLHATSAPELGICCFFRFRVRKAEKSILSHENLSLT